MPRVEFHVSDIDAAKAFYNGLFGWSFFPVDGLEAVSYHRVEGREIGADQALTGGMLVRADEKPDAGGPVRGALMTFEVDDCDERYAWALANGGSEALPPSDFDGIGRVAYAEDGQGNIIGMMTPVRGYN